jgi:hypothetical protein
MSLFNPQTFGGYSVKQVTPPPEGQKICTLKQTLTPTAFNISNALPFNQLAMSQVMSMQIDNSANPAALFVIAGNANQNFSVPPLGGAVFNVTSSTADFLINIFTAAAPAANVLINITLYNYHVPPAEWGPILNATITGVASVNVTNASIPVAQSGAWSIAAVQSGTWNVAQSGAWSISAVQSGTWNVAQSGAWTVAISNATLNIAGNVNAQIQNATINARTMNVGLIALPSPRAQGIGQVANKGTFTLTPDVWHQVLAFNTRRVDGVISGGVANTGQVIIAFAPTGYTPSGLNDQYVVGTVAAGARLNLSFNAGNVWKDTVWALFHISSGQVVNFVEYATLGYNPLAGGSYTFSTSYVWNGHSLATGGLIIGPSPIKGNEWTFECWITQPSVPNVIRALMFDGAASGLSQYTYVVVYLDGTHSGFQYLVAEQGVAIGSVLGTKNVCDNVFHFFQLISDANGYRAYIDGVLDMSMPSNTNNLFMPDQGSLYIGGYLSAGYPIADPWAPGLINEVAIFNFPKSNNNGPAGPYLGLEPGLVALYHVNSDVLDYGPGQPL